MQRQALPLLKPEAALVATGVEAQAAKDSGVCILAKADGVVEYADGKKIVVKQQKQRIYTYLKTLRNQMLVLVITKDQLLELEIR